MMDDFPFKVKAPPFRPLDYTMRIMPNVDVPKYVYFSTDTAALTAEPVDVPINLLLAEIRGIADVSQDEFDECWTKMLCAFPTSPPLIHARALKAFLLKYGRLPVIP